MKNEELIGALDDGLNAIDMLLSLILLSASALLHLYWGLTDRVDFLLVLLTMVSFP